MKTTKHTPGPWDIHTSFDSREIHPLSDEHGLIIIADICPENWDNMEEKEANAKLIAAAPELLEACNQAKEWLNELMAHPNWATSGFGSAWNTFTNLEKAINKATE